MPAKSTDRESNTHFGPRPEDVINGAPVYESPPGGKRLRPSLLKRASDLDKMHFPEVMPIIAGYIVPGLTLLGGKPKVGKSFLIAGWALAVATGGIAMGSIRVEQADVIYLALEDTDQRLHDRMHQMLPDGAGLPSSLTFHTEWKAGEQAVDDLDNELSLNPRVRLVIIDVLNKVRGASTSRDLYANDYAAISPFKKLADQRNIAVIAVHHTSKRDDPEDPFDAFSGTTGMTGAPDSLILLSREKDSQQRRIRTKSRDLDDVDAMLAFDKTTGLFTVRGSADEVRRSDQRKAIMNALAATPWELDGTPGSLTPTDLAAVTGLTSGATRTMLHRMRKDGEVVQGRRGAYRLKAGTDLS